MIPRVIHQIWVSPGGPLPDHLREASQTWQDLHPGWDYILWTDGMLNNLPRYQIDFDYAHMLVTADAVGQLKADIARYQILADIGGFYADIDTIALRNIEPALEGLEEFAAAEDAHWVGNTYLACKPRHPVMQQLVEGLDDSLRGANRRVRPNRLTGPRYLTPIWSQNRCHVASQKLWYPYSYMDVRRGTIPKDVGSAYAIHTWDHTRRVMEGR